MHRISKFESRHVILCKYNKLFFQKLEGRIEDISYKDLVDLTNDLYFLILQKLKEKAIELEKLIDKKSSDGHSSNGTVDEGNAGGLEKDMIKARLSGNRAGFRDKSGFPFLWIWVHTLYPHHIHLGSNK